MSKGKRLSILAEAEIEELYSPPVFSESDQRFFFALNDRELEVVNRIRDRKHRVVAIALLGYFKSKPILLIPSFKSMQADLSFISELYFKDLKYRRFSLKADQKSRLYERVLVLLGISDWNDIEHQAGLVTYLREKANSWAAPRALFDAAIEYLAHNKIAIPAYSTLQKIISQVLVQHQKALHEQVKSACTQGLKDMITELLSGEHTFTLQHLRQSARNFTGTELDKELQVYQHLQPWMDEIAQVQERLGLSQMNQHYYAGRVDYYGAKLKRQTGLNQQLYLLSYLQNRHQQCLERIADGFIHHVRQVKARYEWYLYLQVPDRLQGQQRNTHYASFYGKGLSKIMEYKPRRNEA